MTDLIPNTEAMSKALGYLMDTDIDFARCKTLYDGLKDQEKTILAMAFAEEAGKSAAEREKKAYASRRYREHLSKINDARLSFNELQICRGTQEKIADCWRSYQKAIREGNP